VRTIGVKLTADITGYISGLQRASAATKDFTGQMDQASKAGKLDRVADQATRFGLVGVAAFGLVVKAAADFDKQMSAVSAATHASSGDMDKLRAAALQAGKDTQYSATEAAKGITELSKAGVSTADVLGGGLKGALSLAAAGQLSVGEAAETAASAMTQFKLSGNQVPHVADLLAAAAGKAQGSVHDMGFALNQAGLVASQTGLSIEDTTGTLAAFASAGLIGSDAGTSFKTMLLAIQNPSAKTAEQMKELGISAYDAQGQFIGISKFAGVLQEKLKNLTPQMRAQAMAQIFGNDAVRAANILYTQGQSGIDGWIGKVNDAGYASETAAKLTDNLAGDVERLKGSIETMAIESGSGANGGLRILTKGLNSLVDQFAELPPVVGSGLTVLAGVAGAGALALAGFIKVRKGVASAAEQLTAMGPAGEKAASGLSRAAGMAGKAAAAFVALEVIGIVADHFGAAAVNTDRLSDSLTNLAQTGDAAGELTRVFGKNLENFTKNVNAASSASHGFWGGLNDLTSGIPGVGKVVDSLNEKIYGLSFNQAKDNMQGLDQALVQFMTSTGDARKSSELWNRLLRESGKDTDEFASLLPNAYKKVGELNRAQDAASISGGKMAGSTKAAGGAAAGAVGPTGKAANATREYASAADAAAGAARGETGALTDLNKRLKAQIDPVFGLINAEDDLTKAQKEASKAVKEHGRNSDQARDATRKLALAALDLQGKAGALSNTFNGKLTPQMIATFRAAGLTDRQIQDVAKQFRQAKSDADKYDGKYVAHVSATGVGAVKASLKDLLIAQEALKKGISVSAATSAFNKNSRGFSQGGYTGEGGKYEPAGIVHAGEYVFNAQATSRLGVNRLDEMQQAATMPGYAAGGVVMPFPTTAAMTRVPSKAEAMSVIIPPGPTGGGPTYKWIEAVVHAAFPGMRVLSDYRPGAVTLSGNRSYHAVGRAVDWPPSKPLAEWINLHYKSRTKELITPWNSLNIHNGTRHTYTGAVYRQHNFAGGNAHDHWAMANGGVINEPVFGVGASGATYSFAENGPERVLPTYATPSGGGGGGGVTNIYLTAELAAGANIREAGRQIVEQVEAYLVAGGELNIRGRRILP
jgi:TP901 family phage tail tape measure protein